MFVADVAKEREVLMRKAELIVQERKDQEVRNYCMLYQVTRSKSRHNNNTASSLLQIGSRPVWQTVDVARTLRCKSEVTLLQFKRVLGWNRSALSDRDHELQMGFVFSTIKLWLYSKEMFV